MVPALLVAQDDDRGDPRDPFEDLWKNLEWREVGPFRGGRSCAVAGIPQDRSTYYFGAAGGGVWKTDDAGDHWRNVSDGFFGGSIGSVAVSEWDPNVIYVGTGEKTVRGNVSHGDGMWKSVDAGRTWSHIGLEDSRHICRVRIHPRNPDLVYAAALGHLFGPNEQRGVYRSTDGGENWEQVHFVDENAGCVDLVMDPTNPRVLYASFWRVRRSPWSLESGGEGSSIWKSTDGGDTWVELTHNEGLPEGTIGISGVSVSKADPDNVYLILESENGGLFRSRDGGETWSKVNSERKLRQRAWYYSRCYADPVDPETVYVLNVRFWRSRDGGKTFESISVPHGDNHDLWIDPADPMRMIQSNDGGANVSDDGGQTWTDQEGQPTAQMYRVSLDDDFPYRLLGGQQDNSAIRIQSRNIDGSSITRRNWESTAGGESGHIVAAPGRPDLVFGGSYGGFLSWVDHDSGLRRSVHAWPDGVLGHGAADLRYRFQWNFPIAFSPHDPSVIYIAAQSVFRSDDYGQTWDVISEDLTRNDKSKQQKSGGPITKDDTSVEYYCTVFAFAESPVAKGELWAGSDDGLVHLSRDGGESWTNVTPPDLPEWSQINGLDLHPTDSGTALIAATRYRLDDFRPLIYLTEDYGQTWKSLVTDEIPADHFTRAARFDPQIPELIYAGTERGFYLYNGFTGHWESLQNNLPIVPITDLQVRDDEVVAATQGRGYWILNGLDTLRALARGGNDGSIDDDPVLVARKLNYRVSMGRAENPTEAGTNPHGGVAFDYWLPEEPADDVEVQLTITDSDGNVVRVFETDPERKGDPKLPVDAGANRFAWNLRTHSAREFDGMVIWNRSLRGPQILPGSYTATLRVGDDEATDSFEVLHDLRVAYDESALQAQFDFLSSVRDKLDETHEVLGRSIELRSELGALKGEFDGNEAFEALVPRIDALDEALRERVEVLYQTQSKSRQDPLNFPIRLNDKLGGLNRASGSFAPTAAEIAVRDMLFSQIDQELDALRSLFDNDVPALEVELRQAELPRLGGNK